LLLGILPYKFTLLKPFNHKNTTERNPTHTVNMADKLNLPIREKPADKETSKAAATEQHIDPWNVQSATDENGNELAFDYMAISK
jgi:hypothetical protein